MNERFDSLKLVVINTRRDGKRCFDSASKRRLIEACLEPGVSISDMAHRYGLNVNLLHGWISRYRAEHSVGAVRDKKAPGKTEGPAAAFIPVEIERRPFEPASPDVVRSGGVTPLTPPSREMPTSMPVLPASASRLTVAMPNGVKLELECGGQDAALLAALIETLGRCDVSDRR